MLEDDEFDVESGQVGKLQSFSKLPNYVNKSISRKTVSSVSVESGTIGEIKSIAQKEPMSGRRSVSSVSFCEPPDPESESPTCNLPDAETSDQIIAPPSSA